MAHFGPFWPEEVHSGPFGSANSTEATPDKDAIFGVLLGAVLMVLSGYLIPQCHALYHGPRKHYVNNSQGNNSCNLIVTWRQK